MSQLFASGGQKDWSFSFSTSPSNEYSGLISFRMDWLDLLAVQGTLKSLLQHHSSNHQFFGAQHILGVGGRLRHLSGSYVPEKEMATRFSILTWRILRTEEPGGLQSMGSPRAE